MGSKSLKSVHGSPVTKFRSGGIKAMTVVDLLACAIAPSADDIEASIPAAMNLLRSAGGIKHLQDALAEKLTEAGVDGEFSQLKFYALVELGRRSANTGLGDRTTVTCPEDVEALLADLKDEKKEHFCAVLLDAKKNVLRQPTIHVGTLSMSVVGIREFFRDAIVASADTVIAVHNHPSGDPTPSPEDIQVTQRLVEAGELLGIQLVDHVIISHGGFRSLNRMGLIR